MARDRQPQRQYPRTARVNELVREILGDALERLDDDRLQLVTVTHVHVDPDLRHAVVEFSSLGEGEDRKARLRTAFAAIEAHEDALRERLEAGLAMLPLTVHSRAKRRTPTVLVTFDDVAAADVSVALAGRDINAPSSNFYAWEASHRLGLGEDGGLRVGLAPYSTEDDIDRLLTALGEILSV